MTDLLILIMRLALQILEQQQVGGSSTSSADSILEIISAAKAAWEKETGLPLDVNKIRPYEPI